MALRRTRLAFVMLVVLSSGCRDSSSARPHSVPAASGAISDAVRVRSADISILFVGNSHTGWHDLPGLVCEMIRFRHPGKTVHFHYIPVVHLEETAQNPVFRAEIESRPWKHVVLQAQKISTSGENDYSRTEGIEFAKLAKARGAAVCFYPEWGVHGVAGDGSRQEKVYREMARDAGVAVAPVALAWDLALAERPDLALHAPDGNHQSPLGAFLTACVLVGRLTGDSPAALAAFPYPAADADDRRFLATVAAKTLGESP